MAGKVRVLAPGSGNRTLGRSRPRVRLVEAVSRRPRRLLAPDAAAASARDHPVGIEPVRAAVERETRIMIAHLARQRSQSRRDVYRADSTTITSKRPEIDCEPVALDRREALRQARARAAFSQRRASAPREMSTPRQRAPRRSTAAPARSRPSPFPCRAMRHARFVRARSATKGSDRLDENLGIGPRLQRRRRQPEFRP